MNIIGSSGGYSAAMMSGMQGMRPDPSQLAQQLISGADSDGDGSISQTEFTSFIQSSDSSADSDTISGLFSQLDSDGDGSISSQESTDAIDTMFQNMRQAMVNGGGNGMGGMPPPPPMDGTGGPNATDFMDKADTDGDGSLSEAEFTTALENAGSPGDGAASASQMFSDADTDGDGTISQDELKTAMANHRPPPPPMQGAEGCNGDGTASGGTDGTDQLSFLVQNLLNQYLSDSGSSSTLSVAA